MTFYVRADDINFTEDSIENVQNTFWIPEIDGEHWNEDGVMDDNFGEKAQRNYEIEKLREKYTASKKVGTTHYEKLEQCTYKNDEAQKQFLRDIEEAELDLKLQCKNKYDDRLDILFINEDRVGRDPETREDVDDYYSFRDLNKCQREEIPD